MKTKSKNNTNLASPSSVAPENPLPVNLQNRFDNQMFAEVNQIEIHKSQVHTPTNHHRRFESTNTKSNSYRIRPSNAITEIEINTQSTNLIRTVPGNQSYASTTKHGKKTCSLWYLIDVPQAN